ncbi:MAG: 3'-5' exonuclease [Anaerolineae bacterium]|nr:3'-5' exonuclease [Anaerolineae bacterium]
MAYPETYISVDVETAGPNPGSYSLLSIGACLVADSMRAFYVEVQPVNDCALPRALQVSGLTLEYLAEHGLPPAEAMAQFEAWVLQVTPPGHRPVFVAFNASFDWMFVCDYFHRYLGRNPFRHSALDIKAFYMGMFGVQWHETSMAYLAACYLDGHTLTHNALHDAQDQAEIMRKLLAERGNW